MKNPPGMLDSWVETVFIDVGNPTTLLNNYKIFINIFKYLHIWLYQLPNCNIY